MKKQISFFSTKHRLLKSLGRIMRDERGSILALVLVLCSALLIIMSMLITSVVATTDVNKNVDYSENAYLAARSGITMLAEAGADSSFAGNIIASVGNSQPIKMDFGSEGRCEAYVKDAGDSQDTTALSSPDFLNSSKAVRYRTTSLKPVLISTMVTAICISTAV